MGQQIVNLDKPAEAHADGYRIIRNGPEDFSVEGFFRQDGSQRFRSAKGFPSEVAARQWVYDQLAGPERR